MGFIENENGIIRNNLLGHGFVFRAFHHQHWIWSSLILYLTVIFALSKRPSPWTSEQYWQTHLVLVVQMRLWCLLPHQCRRVSSLSWQAGLFHTNSFTKILQNFFHRRANYSKTVIEIAPRYWVKSWNEKNRWKPLNDFPALGNLMSKLYNAKCHSWKRVN